MSIFETFPGTVTRVWDVFQYGKRVSGGSNIAAGKIGIWKNKTSVDTGKFVPGVYRVNPYSVDHGVAVIGPGYLRGSLTLADAPNTTYVDLVSFDNHYLWAQGLYSELTVLQPQVNNLKDVVLQRAYAKVGSAAAAQGENLGELRETLAMLRNPLGSLRDFLWRDAGRRMSLVRSLADLYKPARRQAARSLTKLSLGTATATWMELRYGLRPLVMTIQDIATQLQKQKRKIDLNRIYSARSYLERESRTPVRRLLAATECANTRNVTAVCTGVVTTSANASVQYMYNVLPPGVDTWGLNLQYLPETAWELTRMSFVWDWLISIGPWLESWRINPSISILGDAAGLKTKKEMVDLKVESQFAYGPAKSVPMQCRIVSESYVRTVSNGRPITPLLMGTAKLDWWKLVDSLALLWQHKPKNLFK